MTVYGKTTEDLESGQVQRPSGGWIWKVCCVLGFLAVCAVLAVLFTWQLQKQEEAADERPPEKYIGDMVKEHAGRHEAMKKIAGNAKAAIHVEGEVNLSHHTTSVQWNSKDGHSFSQGNLTLKDNQIIIPQSGPYFVYSQASFRVNCRLSKDSNQRQVPLIHSVMRFSSSYDDEKTLLSTVQSPCRQVPEGPDMGDRMFSTIYLGAVFHLEKADRLWTHTNHLSEVDDKGGKTFFGVFAL